MTRPEEFDPQIRGHDKPTEFTQAEQLFPASDVDAGLAAAFGPGREHRLVQSSHPSSSLVRNLYQPGMVVDEKYRLIESIGEGGMGSVWYAEQLSPIKRKVAIKLIKPGLDSQSVLARFEAERQALALMDHPNIAKVFDGGVTEFGQPFFVMELVKGTSITTWCDQNKIGPRERLELLIPVCLAIHHAHQKGIIHRDIKPSNVMVAMFDGKPIPKVIDFGVAKAFGPTLTEVSLHTAFGAVVGTAEYMSPEQAQLNNVDIDTRSDVYSLGVLMYELLAGSTPFPRAELAEWGWQEALRVIRDVDPPLPSLRLSTSKMRASIAAQRGIEPAELGKLLKSELDWVIMKSLEKDRVRRYESASALAVDLQRYLRDEPVEACPPSAAYRFRKFIRRYRWQAVIAILFLTTLIGGFIGTSLGFIRAESQRRIAEKAREDADQLADSERAARLEAQRQQRLAEEAEDLTLENFRESTDQGIEDLIGSKLEFGPQERKYLESVLRRWQAFADRQGTDARSRAIRAEGYYHTGKIRSLFGDTETALKSLEQCVAIWKSLIQEFPSQSSYQHKYSLACYRLATVCALQENRERAEAELRQTIKTCEQQIETFPDDPAFRLTQAHCHTELAGLLKELEKKSEAASEYQKGLQILEKLATNFPKEADYRLFLARTQSNLGNLVAESGQHAEAEKLIRASLDTSTSLVTDFPDDQTYRRDLANRYVSFGRLLAFHYFRPDDGIEPLRAGQEVYEKLVAEYPSMFIYRKELAVVHDLLATILMYQGKFDESAEQLLQSVRINQRLVNDFPKNNDYRFALAVSYEGMGNLAREQGNAKESVDWYDKGLELLKSVDKPEGHTTQSRDALISCLLGRAYALAELKQDQPADWEAVRDNIPVDGTQKTQIFRAILLLRAGQVNRSLDEMNQLIDAANRSAVDPPWTSSHWYDAACFFSIACSKAADRQREFAMRSVELLNRAIENGYTNLEHLMRDSDLNALRETPEFKKLLEDLRDKLKPDHDEP